MNDEDTDWQIYHLIPEHASVPVGDLSRTSGIAADVVAASLDRLERYCLVEMSGTSVRKLTFGESLIRNQIKYDKDLPFSIENGVIRARKD